MIACCGECRYSLVKDGSNIMARGDYFADCPRTIRMYNPQMRIVPDNPHCTIRRTFRRTIRRTIRKLIGWLADKNFLSFGDHIQISSVACHFRRYPRKLQAAEAPPGFERWLRHWTLPAFFWDVIGKSMIHSHKIFCRCDLRNDKHFKGFKEVRIG